MRRLLQQLLIIFSWVAWPGFWLILNNTERSRLMLFNDGKLLVAQDWFNSKWALPGGGRHPGESAVDAVVRETYEELGIKLDTKLVKPLFSEKIRDRGINATWDYFVAEVALRPEVKQVSRFEVYSFAWLSPTDLNPKNAGRDVLNGLAKYLSKE